MGLVRDYGKGSDEWDIEGTRHDNIKAEIFDSEFFVSDWSSSQGAVDRRHSLFTTGKMKQVYINPLVLSAELGGNFALLNAICDRMWSRFGSVSE